MTEEPAGSAPPPSTLRLPDGRRLAWAEYGDPGGAPLLYFHGTPGSRVELAMFSGVGGTARSHGVRLIAPDRPGMGGSDFQLGRTIADWPADVEALAAHLGLERYAVLGYSGGTPYAGAVAHALPAQVTTAGMVACVAHLAPGLDDGLDPNGLRMKAMARDRPRLGGLVLAATMGVPARFAPGWLLRQADKSLPEVDRAVLHEPGAGRAFAVTVKEAFRHGARGPRLDMALMTGPWGFDLEGITVPVHLWQGTLDTFGARPAMAEHLHRAIPGSRLGLSGDGHLSVFSERIGEILDVLVGRG